MVKNDDIVLTIDGQGSEGEGVGHADGMAVFVPGLLIGEEAEVRIVKVKRTYAYGKAVRILKPSTARVEPVCPVYRQCGGCHLQHMSYAEELRFKTDRVAQAMRRIGGLSVLVHPAEGMENPLAYRNKAQFPVGSAVDGGVRIGFYAKRSHVIVDSDTCLIQHPSINRAVEAVRGFLETHKISLYNEKTGGGFVRHLFVRVGFATGEVMVCLVTAGKDFAQSGEFVEAVRAACPEVVSIQQNVNPDRTNVILGQEAIILYGKDTIRDKLGGLDFDISLRSFYQVNPAQTQKLYQKALELADLSGRETVLDLYCGIGTISLFLARHAKRVYGVEIVSEAVRDAKHNAQINGIANAEFIEGDAKMAVERFTGEPIDCIVIDPPRTGCDEAVLTALGEIAPEKVVYISCNPATLARDLKLLSELGFVPGEVYPFDLFPRTYHIECCVSLQRAGDLKRPCI